MWPISSNEFVSWWWKASNSGPIQENYVRSLPAEGRKELKVMQGNHSDNSKCDINVGHEI